MRLLSDCMLFLKIFISVDDENLAEQQQAPCRLDAGDSSPTLREHVGLTHPAECQRHGPTRTLPRNLLHLVPMDTDQSVPSG